MCVCSGIIHRVSQMVTLIPFIVYRLDDCVAKDYIALNTHKYRITIADIFGIYYLPQ